VTLEAQAHQRFTTKCYLAGRPHTDHVPGSRAPERAVRCAAPAHRNRLQGPQRPLSQKGQQGVPEARHHAIGLLPVPAPSCVSWPPRKHRRMRCEFLGRRQLCLKWHAEPQRKPHTSHQPEPRLCSCCDSESRGAFTPIEATPLKFREDGQPISACRLPGRPLMVGRCTCCQCLPLRSAGMEVAVSRVSDAVKCVPSLMHRSTQGGAHAMQTVMATGCNCLQVPKRPDMESLAAASRCTAAHQRSSRIQCAAMPFLHATRCTPSSVSVTQLHLPWHLCSPLRYLEIAHVRRYCSLCSAACTPLCRRYYAALEMHSSSWFVRQMMVCMPLPAHVGAGPARRLCR